MEIEKAIEGIKDIIKQVPKLKEQNNEISVGFPVFGDQEMANVMRALLNGKISQGPFVRQFESDFAKYIGRKHAISVNSGSSANLLALQSLIDTGKLNKGDEVIIPATTFITVVTPIIQVGLVPVFVDIDADTINISISEIENSISDKAKAIMPVHTLGLPADMPKIMQIAKKHNLVVLEDSCEAHGASINGMKTGSFADVATFSFFVAHNMTTGEGGMILTDDDDIAECLRSLREFGRLSQPKTIGERLSYSKGKLKNYDTRYVFNTVGYNLRMTDTTAAFGIEQLKRLDDMNEKRVKVVKGYNDGLNKYSKFIGVQPEREGIFHSYYGYPILIKKGAPFDRHKIVSFLESKNIETRPIFAGCLPDQPAFSSGNYNFKESGELKNSRFVRDNGFFIGCHPMISDEGVKHILSSFDEFFNSIQNVK